MEIEIILKNYFIKMKILKLKIFALKQSVKNGCANRTQFLASSYVRILSVDAQQKKNIVRRLIPQAPVTFCKNRTRVQQIRAPTLSDFDQRQIPFTSLSQSRTLNQGLQTFSFFFYLISAVKRKLSISSVDVWPFLSIHRDIFFPNNEFNYSKPRQGEKAAREEKPLLTNLLRSDTSRYLPSPASVLSVVFRHRCNLYTPSTCLRFGSIRNFRATLFSYQSV